MCPLGGTMNENPRPAWKRGLKILVTGLVAAAALIAVTYGVLSVAAARREKAVLAAWAQAGRPLDAFVASLPVTEPNATARKLEETADALGMVRGEKKEPWKSIASPLNEYINAELEKTGPGVAAPPEAVAAFLRDQAPLIERVRAALLDGPPPVWEERDRSLYGAPLPGLLQIIGIERILAADALEALSRGDAASAMLDADAGWRMGEAMETRPELISALITMASFRYPAGILRHVDGAGETWRRRLEGYVPRESVARGWEYEAASMLELGRGGLFDPAQGPTRRLRDRITRPYVRLSVAGSLGTMLEMLETAETAGPCPEGLEARIDEVIQRIPSWNALAKLAIPNTASSWQRAHRLQLDLELTGKILLAKEARDANGGAWPDAVPGIEASVCPEGRWTYARSAGRVSITYDRVPRFNDLKPSALVLPMTYEEPIAPAVPPAGRGPSSRR